jgi:hypothetical protein
MVFSATAVVVRLTYRRVNEECSLLISVGLLMVFFSTVSVNFIDTERGGDGKREGHGYEFWDNSDTQNIQQMLCETLLCVCGKECQCDGSMNTSI